MLPTNRMPLLAEPRRTTEDQRNYSANKLQRDKLQQAQDKGFTEYSDESHLNSLISSSDEPNVPTEVTPSPSPMISVENEINLINRQIARMDYHPSQQSHYDALIQKLHRAQGQGITFYRDLDHLDTLLSTAQSNSKRDITTTTTTTTTTTHKVPSGVETDAPLLLVKDQIKALEIRTNLNRDSLGLLDLLKEAARLGITHYRDFPDLHLRVNDAFIESSSTASTAGTNDEDAQRLEELEGQLNELRGAGVREADLEPLKKLIRQAKGE